MDLEDPLVQTRMPFVKPLCPAGHLILWDSRTFHANVYPQQDDRMAVYVCMLPRKDCPETQRQKRIQLYEQGRMTSHWPYGKWLSVNGAHPKYTRDKPQPLLKDGKPEIATLNKTQQRLVGYVV